MIVPPVPPSQKAPSPVTKNCWGNELTIMFICDSPLMQSSSEEISQLIVLIPKVE